MTADRPTGPPTPSPDDPIAALLRVAGRRPTAPDAVVARVREATTAAWRREVRRRRRNRTWTAIAAVAAVVVALLGLRATVQSRLPAPAVEAGAPGERAVVATVEVVAGPPARLTGVDTGDEPRRIEPDDAVPRGARLETGAAGGVALRLAGGGSLRVGPSSVVELPGPDDVILAKGLVYVDGGAGTSGAVGIHTEAGVVRERGTQFEVRTGDREVRVRVREGAVVLERAEPVEAGAGVELRVGRGGEVARGIVSASDDSWSWVLDLAPSFDLDGRELGEFLAWVERETGKEVRFADEKLAARVAPVVVYGSVEGLRPDEALAAVLPTCGLTATEGRDTIELSPR